MSVSFLGTGWKFPVALDRGQIVLSTDEESIREAIWIILATARGERQMQPDFGCGLHGLVFATDSAETTARVAADVRAALLLWEPRIDLENVEVKNDPAKPGCLPIHIEYRVRSTNNRFNLVYPFYLE